MGIPIRMALSPLVLFLAAMQIYAKTDSFRVISDLARQCDSQHNRDACSQLARIAAEDANEIVRREAVKQLADEQSLARVALGAEDPEIRTVAVRKLTDPELLAKIALDEKDAGAREAAVWKLSDQGLLARIAQEDKAPVVRRAAVDKLTDYAVLAKVARQDGDPEVRRAAEGKLPHQASPLASAAEGSAPAPTVAENNPAHGASMSQVGMATVHIYRNEKRGFGNLSAPLVFVNDKFLGLLTEGGSTSVEVPQGTLVVTTTRNVAPLEMPPPPLSGSYYSNNANLPGSSSQFQSWSSLLPECADLDWHQMRLVGTQPPEIARCVSALNHAYGATARSLSLNSATDDVIKFCYHPFDLGGHEWTPGYNRGYLLECQGYFYRFLSLFNQQVSDRIDIEVEAGKTYYIRWAPKDWGRRSGVMTAVDAATGAKEFNTTW